MTDGDAARLDDRRSGSGERRRYNRRSAADPGSPPYYEVFERIAMSLESIEAALSRPPADAASRPPHPRTGRGAGSQDRPRGVPPTR